MTSTDQARLFLTSRFREHATAWHTDRVRHGHVVALGFVKRAAAIRALHARRLQAWRTLRRLRLARILQRLRRVEAFLRQPSQPHGSWTTLAGPSYGDPSRRRDTVATEDAVALPQELQELHAMRADEIAHAVRRKPAVSSPTTYG